MTNQNTDVSCKGCCCKHASCCNGKSFRSSLARIILAVLVLCAVFFWGVKFGMGGFHGSMHNTGGRGKSGCMFDRGNRNKEKKADMMDKQLPAVVSGNDLQTPPAEQPQPTEAITEPTPTEETVQ